MTVKEAKETFARLMSTSRTGALTPAQRKTLRTASQMIRHSRRKTASSNTHTSSSTPTLTFKPKKVWRKTNPGKGTILIYDKVTRIEATKGRSSLYPGQKFYHKFKRPYPKMYGLPDGSLLIK
jgi:hypothetical protein